MSGLKKQLRGHCHGQWRFFIRATWAVAQGSNIGQSFFSPLHAPMLPQRQASEFLGLH